MTATPNHYDSKPTCKVDGCNTKTDSRGMCHKHYMRWSKGLMTLDGKPVPPEERNQALAEVVRIKGGARKVRQAKASGEKLQSGQAEKTPTELDATKQRVHEMTGSEKYDAGICNAPGCSNEAVFLNLCAECAAREYRLLHEDVYQGGISTEKTLCGKDSDKEAHIPLPKGQTMIPGYIFTRFMSIPVDQGHPRFFKIIGKMAEIHAAKNQDYGAGDLLGNFKESAKLGIDPFRGCLVRLSDKYARVMSLSRPGSVAQVKDEAIEDTLLDLANYAILSLILYQDGLEKDKDAGSPTEALGDDG